jgi:hypothetical protein
VRELDRVAAVVFVPTPVLVAEFEVRVLLLVLVFDSFSA